MNFDLCHEISCFFDGFPNFCPCPNGQIYNVCFKDNMEADADVEFGCELMLIVAADDLINS